MLAIIESVDPKSKNQCAANSVQELWCNKTTVGAAQPLNRPSEKTDRETI